MAYAGISALLDAGDKRSHKDWLNAVLYERHRELWLNAPAGFRADMAGLMDLAAERAVREERAAWRTTMKNLGPWLAEAKSEGSLDALIEGNIWPEPSCVISEADVQRSIEIARRIRPQIEAEQATLARQRQEEEKTSSR